MWKEKLTLLLLALLSPLIANNLVICTPDACINTTIDVDALYWSPCTEQFQYARFQTNTATHESLKPLLLDPDDEWGFRVAASIADECDCNYASVEWAHINGTSSVTTYAEGRHLSAAAPILFDANAVFGSVKTRYNKVSLKLGHRLCGDECASIALYIGGRYAEMRVRQLTQVLGDLNSFYFRHFLTKFNGGGIEVGLRAAWEVWSGWGLTARLGTLALVGQRKYTLSYTPNASEVNHSSHAVTQCVGGIEARLCVNYTYQSATCWWLRGEVGYEHQHYIDALLRLQLTRYEDHPATNDFGIGGLFFGVVLGF